LIFLDDDHELIADKNLLIKYKDNKIVYKKELKFKYSKAWLSPHGKYLLYYDNDIFLMNIDSFKKVKLKLPQTEVYSIAWSEDEGRLAIVQGHQTLEDTDLISFFNLQ
jgi:WD40 repeat protein